MDLLVVLVIAAVLLVDAIIFIAVFKAKKAKREKLRTTVLAAAEAEGWQSLPTTESNQLYRLGGAITPDISWEITAYPNGRSSTRSNSSFRSNYRPTVQTITWQTKDIRLQGKVIGIGPGGGLRVTEVDLGHRLIQTALQRIYGDDLAARLARAQIVELPEQTIPRLYMVISNDPDLAGEFLREPVPSILRDWQSEKMPVPAILIWEEGMWVRFRKVSDEIEALREIAAFCGALAVRGKDIANETE